MMPAYYANARHDVLAMIPKLQFERVLEIGGGDFPTLRTIVGETNATGWGVDIRAPEAELDNFVLGSITDPVVRAELPSQGFDLILANDVIEHVEDTEGFFNVVHGVLQPNGLLALSVPNIRQIRSAYQIYLRGTFPRDDSGLFDRTHLRWFCRADVMRYATKVGLELVEHRGNGRAVPKWLRHSRFAELLSLQNLFLFRK